MQAQRNEPNAEMNLDEAIEKLGGLVSRAGEPRRPAGRRSAGQVISLHPSRFERQAA